jgi:hypothetical protein
MSKKNFKSREPALLSQRTGTSLPENRHFSPREPALLSRRTGTSLPENRLCSSAFVMPMLPASAFAMHILDQAVESTFA